MIYTDNNCSESPAPIQSKTKNMAYDFFCNGEIFRNRKEINICQWFGMTKDQRVQHKSKSQEK